MQMQHQRGCEDLYVGDARRTVAGARAKPSTGSFQPMSPGAERSWDWRWRVRRPTPRLIGYISHMVHGKPNEAEAIRFAYGRYRNRCM